MISKSVKRRVYARDGRKCHYCGTEHAAFTLDHKIAAADGGRSADDNLVVACWSCNQAKGRMPYALFIAQEKSKIAEVVN